jgi:Protein of unknown function (DUF2797)
MFVRADRLLLGEKVRWYSKHALWYYWDGFRPHLDSFDLVKKEVESLDLVDRMRLVNLAVSDERECVGSYMAGEYRPCPNHITMKGAFDQCRSCAGTWIPIQECLFEPQCAGDLCDSPLCKKKHVVYATFFGNLIKIGMTAGSRLKERAIEQGADAVVRLSEFPNRLAAREAEKDISRKLKAPQRVAGKQVAAEIARSPTRCELREKYEKISVSISGDYELLGENMLILDEYPGREKLGELPETPELVDVVGAHVGVMLGIKGRYLFYENLEGKALMLPMSELPSRFLELGGGKG